MTEIDGLSVRIGADTNEFTRALGAVENRVSRFSEAVDRRVGTVDLVFERLRGTLTGVAGVLAGGFALGGAADMARAGITAADAWSLAQSKIALYAGGAAAAVAMQEQLFQVAQRSRSALEPVVGLYTSLADSMLSMGKGQGDVVRVTETISKTFKISGTEAGAAAGAITQLSQALSAGVLRGDEFNSVMEASPRLAKALADGLQVPRGALRALAEQGALTADKVVNALLRQGGAIDSEYGKVAVTVGDAMTALSNAAARQAGLIDQSAGATAALSSGLLALAGNMDLVAASAIKGGAALLALATARAIPAGIGSVTAALAAQRGAMEDRLVATARATAADKAAAAQALISAKATYAYREADVMRRLAASSTAAATLAGAEADLAAARAKTALTTNTYFSASAAQAERYAATAATVAREASVVADTEKTAALGRLAAGHAAVTVASDNLTAASLRSNAASLALGSGVSAGAMAMAGLRSAAQGLLALVGGPWGAALLAGAGAVALIATRTTEAERAAEAFTVAQEAARGVVRDSAPDVDALAKEYARLGDGMRSVTALKIEEAVAKQAAALAALRKAASFTVAQSPVGQVVESNHGSDLLNEVYGYERMGLAAAQVERLRAALEAFRLAAKDDPQAVATLVAVLEQVGRQAGDAGKPLLDLARKLADGATSAVEAGKAMVELQARLTLLRDPANEAAKAVLKAGQDAAAATSGMSGMGVAVGTLAGKLADLNDKARMLALPEGFARQLAEVAGLPPEPKTPVVTGAQDRRTSEDDTAYQRFRQGNGATEVVLQRYLNAQSAETVRLAKLEAEAKGRLADARATGSAQAVREAQVELQVIEARRNGLVADRESEYRKWRLAGASADARAEAGEAIVQLKLETAAQERNAAVAGKGEAAQRRARIENEVAAAALKGLAGATREALEAQEESTRQGLHAAFADEIDLEVAANRRLAEAMAKGAEAVREAEILNAALSQTLKEVPYDEQTLATGEWNAALEANIAKLREQQSAADQLDLSRYGQQLDSASRKLAVEQSTLGLSEDAAAAARARADVLENLRARGREYDKLTAAERSMVDAQVRQAEQNAALELGIKRQRSAMDAVGEAVDNGLVRPLESAVSAIVQGQGESLKWGNILKGMATSLIGDFGKMALLNPARNLLGLGSYAPTLWDAVGSGTAATGQTGGGTGTLQAASTASSLSNIVSGSTSLYNAGQWFATSQAGQFLGMSTAPTTSSFIVGGSGGLTSGLQGSVVGNTPAMTGLGSAFSEGLSYSPWGAIGSIGASMMGIGKNADPYAKMAFSTIGSIGGGMAGAAAGSAIGGTVAGMQMGSVLGPIGAVVGAVIGTALSGLIKADQQYPMSYYYGSIGEGLGNGAELDGGDASGMTKAGQAAKQGVIALAKALAIDTATLPQGGFFDNRAGHPNLSGMPTGIGAFIDYEGGGWSNAKMTDSIEEAVVQYIRMSLQYSKLDGVKEDVKTAIKNSDAKTVEDLTADLDFADQFSDRVKSMTGALTLEDQARDAGVQAAKALASQITGFVDTTKRLGLNVDAAESATRQWVDALVEGADPKTATTWEAAVTQLKAQWGAMGPVLQAVGYTAEEAGRKIGEGLGNNLEKLKDSYQDSRAAALRQLEGRGYLNDLRSVETQRDTDVRDRKALGLSEKEADADARLRAQAVLSQLNAAQLDDVIGTFGGVIKDAALEIRATLGKSTVSTLGQQQRSAEGRGYLNDLDGLVAARDANVAALEKLRQDTAAATGLFGASLRSVLDGLTAPQLRDAAATFGGEIAQLASTLAAAQESAAAAQESAAAAAARDDLHLREMRAQAQLLLVSGAAVSAEEAATAARRELAAATDDATASVTRHVTAMERQAAAAAAARESRGARQGLLQQAYEANGRTYRATLAGFDRTAEADLLASLASGNAGDVALLLATQQKQRALTELESVQSLIAAQISARQGEVSAIRESVEAQRSLRAQLLDSAAALKLDTSVTALGPEERALEARRQWSEALTKADAGDTAALAKLSELGRGYIQAWDKDFKSGTSREAFDAVVPALERFGLSGGEVLAAQEAQVAAADAQVAALEKLRQTAEQQLLAARSVPATLSDIGDLLSGAVDRSTAATAGLEQVLSRYSAPSASVAGLYDTLFGPVLKQLAPGWLMYEDGAGREMSADRYYQLAFLAGHTGTVGNGEISARRAADAAFNVRLESYIDMYFAGLAGGIVPDGLPSAPVKAYATGGVSYGPQLAMVSEGAFPAEAHVPLPDGRTIPVSLRFAAPALPERLIPPPVVPEVIAMAPAMPAAALTVALTPLLEKLDTVVTEVRRGALSAAGIGDDTLAVLREVSDVIDALPRRIAAAGGR